MTTPINLREKYGKRYLDINHERHYHSHIHHFLNILASYFKTFLNNPSENIDIIINCNDENVQFANGLKKQCVKNEVKINEPYITNSKILSSSEISCTECSKLANKDVRVNNLPQKLITEGSVKDIENYSASVHNNNNHFNPSVYVDDHMSKDKVYRIKEPDFAPDGINYIVLKTGENITADVFNEIARELILNPDEIKILVPGQGIFPLLTFPTNATDLQDIQSDAVGILGTGLIIRPSILLTILQFIEWIKHMEDSFSGEK